MKRAGAQYDAVWKDSHHRTGAKPFNIIKQRAQNRSSRSLVWLRWHKSKTDRAATAPSPLRSAPFRLTNARKDNAANVTRGCNMQFARRQIKTPPQFQREWFCSGCNFRSRLSANANSVCHGTLGRVAVCPSERQRRHRDRKRDQISIGTN